MKWKPKRFWSTPLYEWVLTVDYLNSKDADKNENPMTSDRLEELHKQYPDTPNLRRKKPDG